MVARVGGAGVGDAEHPRPSWTGGVGDVGCGVWGVARAALELGPSVFEGVDQLGGTRRGERAHQLTATLRVTADVLRRLVNG